MKIYYVDAENVGIDFLAEKKVSILDKVFVFTNNESFKSECEKLLYACVSGYPAGKNQADFYMIAHLARLLSQLSDKEKGAVNFIFCSKDQDLLKAFDSQCLLAGIKAFSSYPAEKKAKPNNANKKNTKSSSQESRSLESLILDKFAQLSKIDDVRTALKRSKPEFTTAINKLIKAGKIKRQSKASKKWRCADRHKVSKKLDNLSKLSRFYYLYFN